MRMNHIEAAKQRGMLIGHSSFMRVPSMAHILLVQVQPRVFTAKCSEPQVGISNGMDDGSDFIKRRPKQCL